MKPSVSVMLSTYNGDLYILEQVDSILAQKQVEVKLSVRDDGSSDHTLEQLKAYEDRICVTQGTNLGAAGSFMQMIYENEGDTDYYAFADQDDIWLPEKMQSACRMLHECKGPALYCSNQVLVDAKGTTIGTRYQEPPDASWMQIVCGNPFSGCTMVWNRELQKLLVQQDRRPSSELLKKRMHDVWLAAVASTVGRILYDPKPYILYRQHESNVVGAKPENKMKLWKKKLHDPTLRNGRSDLCKELLNTYQDLIAEDVKGQMRIIGHYRTDPSCRKKLWRMKQIAVQSGESVFAYRLKIMLRLV